MRLIVVLLAAALWCGSVQAQVPRQINYQGFLTNPGNTPVNATVAMTLRIYNAATGGAPLYSETQAVTVANGEFSVLIGSVTPLTLQFDAPYYLGITIEADPEMTPRQAVAASPYALRSVSTETLSSSASVPASQVTGTIGAAQIANGAVTQPKLSATGAAAGKVLGTDGTNLVWQTAGGGGTVTTVTASSPLASSGGNAPNISLTGPIPGSLLASNLTLGGTTTGTFSGPLTGNIIGNVSGSAGSAVSFTGALAGNVTGTQSATVVSSVGGATAASVAAGVALANAATDAITANTLVKRNDVGNFSANGIGIGTTIPASKFHVVSGASNLPARLESSGTTSFAAGWDFYQGATGKGYVGVPDASAGIGPGEMLLFGGSGTKTSLWAGGNRGITIGTDGHVGIGTDTPTKAFVEINGFFGLDTFSQCTLFSFDGGIPCPPGASVGTVTLYGAHNIAGTSFVAFSDERIKRIEGRSDAARDLATLAGIEVTDYRYIDTVTKGSGKQKKLIGQQVEKVYPQAVSRSTDVVPDIYKKAQVNDAWINLATNLKKGERVRLIGKKNEGIHEVLEVTPGKFRTDFAADADAVFVFGREVKDFRVVDYEAIAMLNVSATQELKRQVERQAAASAAQTEDISKLSARIAELQQDRQAQTARIESLEQQAVELVELRQQAARMAILLERLERTQSVNTVGR